MSTRLGPLAAGLALALTTAGCGEEPTTTSSGGPGTGGGNTLTDGGADDSSNADSEGNGDDQSSDGPDGDGADATDGNDGEDCGRATYKAEGRQLDIYVMFDNSGSMIPWWPAVTDALSSFVDDPRSAGIGVGIQYFGQSCDVNTYATPKVPIAPLPGNAAAIKGSYPLPFADTPTTPALQGAITHARSWAEDHPESKVVVFLVTDGMPDDCNSTVDTTAAQARLGLEGSPSIPTYVLGIGNGLALDAIAQAGGTDKAIVVGATKDAVYQAMSEIRGAALPCDYAVPDDAEDPNLVNLTLKTGDKTTTIPNVGTEAGCEGSTKGGWYYNDGKTRLIACDATCNDFNEAEAGSSVDVVLGCPTVTVL
jgi:hypothetical protein